MSSNERRLELERKKLKLEEIRREKERRKREREQDGSAASAAAQGSTSFLPTPTRTRDEADSLLRDLGIETPSEMAARNARLTSGESSTSAASPPRAVETSTGLHDVSTGQGGDYSTSPRRPTTLKVVSVAVEASIAPKESVTYSKQTQTTSVAGDREGSLSSQTDSPFSGAARPPRKAPHHPVDYYVIHWDEDSSVDMIHDKNLEWDDEFQVLTYDDVPGEEEGEGSIPFGTPPPSYQSRVRPRKGSAGTSGGLPHVEPVRPAETRSAEDEERERSERARRESEAAKKKTLTEDEKRQILLSEDFLKFFTRAVTITERAISLNEPADLCIDYAGEKEELKGEERSGMGLTQSRTFFDARFCANRIVTGFDWSTYFPELLAVSYASHEDQPVDHEGIVCVWNMKFKKTSPEYTFQSHSPVMSLSFAKFHQNLLIGGLYSGQVVLWDNRVNKRTPVQRSPLSTSAHTHPVYSMQVVGTQNAHNVITISTDGKLCSWSVDMLSTPQDTLELSQQKQSRPVAVTCMSFLAGDVNNFIIGSEEGDAYTACRHGTKTGIMDPFEGHQGGITGIHSNNVESGSSVDFSHLFLTSSTDWTVKLWSTKDNKQPIHSFEDNGDYVYDCRWSPSHPAVFSTVDGMGRLDVWNLINDTELPTATARLDGFPALNKVTWTPAGDQIAVGDDSGKVSIFDVGEQLVYPKMDDTARLMTTLQELKENRLYLDGSGAGGTGGQDSYPPSEAGYASLSSAASLLSGPGGPLR